MQKFSVIIPIFKVEKYINKCIDSVLNQSYTNFELILVDDGSPDSCPDICDGYAAQDERVKVIHKVNGGLVSARKAGAKICDGEYVVCLDGDDWLEPSMLETLNTIVEKFHPDVVCCGARFISENKIVDRELKYDKGYYSKKEIEERVFPSLIQSSQATYFSPSLWAKAFKRDLYTREQLSVDDRIKIGEDGACTIPIIYHATSLFVLKDPLYNYRQNNASMTKGHKVFDTEGPRLIAEHISSRIDLNDFGFQQQLSRKVVHDLFTVIMSLYNQQVTSRQIRLQINTLLTDPFYYKAILDSHFTTIKAKAMSFCLRRRQCWLMKLAFKLRYY